jgi:hypothetical protein
VFILQFEWSSKPDTITADKFYEENNISIKWVIFTSLWHTSHYYLATDIRRNNCGEEREVLSYMGVALPAMKRSFVQNCLIGFRMGNTTTTPAEVKYFLSVILREVYIRVW